MTPQAFHALTALADGEAHGSAIARDVLDRTGGTMRLWPATLYRLLDTLVRDGLILELTGSRHPTGESERRRYYRLTPAGRAALRVEAARLADMAGIARRRLGRS
jgi:DNA-binding PadR family transcriptional regulator